MTINNSTRFPIMTYAAAMSQLSTSDFFAVIDRNSRNDDLHFEKVCKLRSDDELVDTLCHWQDKPATRRSETYIKILKAEISDRMGRDL